jgi:molybdate transport system substrate-binding protein
VSFDHRAQKGEEGDVRRLVWKWIAPVAVLALAAAMLVGQPAVASAPAANARPTGSITVSAAASLTEAFNQIKTSFEKRYKRSTVTYNFGSSTTLATQIQSGAPADVFASADLTNMDRLVTAGKVNATPTIFARNQMEIAVKPGNPKSVRTLTDLRSVGTIALCGTTVPCGVYAANVLSRAGVSIPESSITRGVDAKATLSAVAQGDANAAIVYVTDVNAAGSTVQGVEIPDDQNTIAVYPIAPIAGSSNAKLAKAFVAYVSSPAGQRTLVKYGFVGP